MSKGKLFYDESCTAVQEDDNALFTGALFAEKDYLVLSLSFEAADEYFQSLESLAEGLVMDIGECLRAQNVSEEIIAMWNSPLSEKVSDALIWSEITALCSACQKKVILTMIDGVDKRTR